MQMGIVRKGLDEDASQKNYGKRDLDEDASQKNYGK